MANKKTTTTNPMEVDAEQTRLSVLVATIVERARKRVGFTKTELAARAGVPKSRVSAVIAGTENVTLQTLARFGLACGVHWEIRPLSLRRKP